MQADWEGASRPLGACVQPCTRCAAVWAIQRSLSTRAAGVQRQALSQAVRQAGRLARGLGARQVLVGWRVAVVVAELSAPQA